MKELDKITNLDSIYYVDSYHKVFKSIEEFKINDRDSIEILGYNKEDIVRKLTA